VADGSHHTSDQDGGLVSPKSNVSFFTPYSGYILYHSEWRLTALSNKSKGLNGHSRWHLVFAENTHLQ